MARELLEILEDPTCTPARTRELVLEELNYDASCLRGLVSSLEDPMLRPTVRERAFQKMLATDLLEQIVSNPEISGLDAARELTQMAVQTVPGMGLRLAKELGGWEDRGLPVPVILRLLVLVSETTDMVVSRPLLSRVSTHPSPHVRSKFALILGKDSHSVAWLKEQLKATDARVRANAIEAIMHHPHPEARKTLQEAAADSNNRVAGNALLALYHLEGPAVLSQIMDMANHESQLFRRTAVWVIEQTADLYFLDVLARMAQTEGGQDRLKILRARATIRRKSEEARIAAAPASPVSTPVTEPQQVA